MKKKDDDPATKFVRRREEKEDPESDEPLPRSLVIGIGAGILIAIAGVIWWLVAK